MYSIEIERPTTKELFEAAAGYGFTKMQFDFSSVCDEQMPETIEKACFRKSVKPRIVPA